MSRVVGWRAFVIVALSALGALSPLKKGVYTSWYLWDYRSLLPLYLLLAGLGLAAYCLQYYKLVFTSGLASAALCLWAYWRNIWLPSTQVEGLTLLIPTRMGWGWLFWLAVAVFLCVIATQEGVAGGENPRE